MVMAGQDFIYIFGSVNRPKVADLRIFPRDRALRYVETFARPLPR